MNPPHGRDIDEPVVPGFEVPNSPDASYNNVYITNEDEVRDPPTVPDQLQQTTLSYPSGSNGSSSVPEPQNVVLNHLYIENREAPRSVVGIGFTHRFRSKFVAVVLYKPVPRNGGFST